MSSSVWDAAYRSACSVTEAINWEFLCGLLLLGSLWAVIWFGFAMVGA
jgi:hypothetical protein